MRLADHYQEEYEIRTRDQRIQEQVRMRNEGPYTSVLIGQLCYTILLHLYGQAPSTSNRRKYMYFV